MAGLRFDPVLLLDQVTVATRELVDTCAGFSDVQVREPSLLPGWSRGHVLTHLARNADGGRRLLSWARTGIKSAEYPSLAARAEQIEAGSARSAHELLADLADSAERFATGYRQMPPAAWERVVRWTAGPEHPAARAADARLCEVLVHHVDLDAGYTPERWPENFTSTNLDTVVASLARRPQTPAMRLHATDSGRRYEIGATPLDRVIQGPQCWLLAWLMGRTRGHGLTVRGDEVLPNLPFLY